VVEADDVPLVGSPGVAAGWHAEDPGRPAAREADAPPRERLHLVGVGSLEGENRPLALRGPAGVVAETIRADHPVAGNQDRDRVAAERGSHGPHRSRSPDLLGNPGVRSYLSPGDLQRLHEYRALEVGELSQVEAQAVAGALVPRRLAQSVGDRRDPGQRTADLGIEPLL